jgi:hypothetical protein
MWTLRNGVNAMAHMNSRRDESYDKVVIDPAELEATAPSTSRVVSGELMLPLARGTREQVVARGSASEITERQLPRDPVAVLRAYPHSTGAPPAPPPRTRSAPPSPGGRRIQDKIVLAHLALDLFQEIDQLQAIVQRAHDGTPCDPDSGTCSDPRCAATVDVLRGALVEACLLVQRVAMMPPDERLDIEDRIHELLELLHHTRLD